jgi:dTDP-4-dehydrorhamnose reductase
MQKIWITGAKGRVGAALTHYFQGWGYKVYATDLEDCDVSDEAAVMKLANSQLPDVIINCAGYTDVAGCTTNEELAYKVNAIGARNLAMAARSTGALLVQLSTDDVFDGTATQPYHEFDQTIPRSTYGKSKLAGEDFVKTLSGRYLIIRSCWVYGGGNDMVSFVLDAAKKGDPLQMPNNQIASPTSVKEIARTIAAMLNTQECGTYHVVCKGACSRYEFAKEVLKKAHKDIPLEPIIVEDQRPNYSVLDTMMLRITGVEEPKEWTAALSDYIIESHFG